MGDTSSATRYPLKSKLEGSENAESMISRFVLKEESKIHAKGAIDIRVKTANKIIFIVLRRSIRW